VRLVTFRRQRRFGSLHGLGRDGLIGRSR
jgi:hypothetical protein